MNCKFFTIACALLSMSFCSWANENKTDSVGYQFTVTKELKTNPVKDQSRSGTCWSFSTLSFIEDDLLRQGKPAVDLSEMFIVRNDYIEKAIKYAISPFRPGVALMTCSISSINMALFPRRFIPV